MANGDLPAGALSLETDPEFTGGVTLAGSGIEEGDLQTVDPDEPPEVVETKSAIDKFAEDSEVLRTTVKKILENMGKPGSSKKVVQDALDDLKDISADTTQVKKDINRLRKIANTKGPTEFAKSLLEFQKEQEGIQFEQLEKETGTQTAQLTSALAARGGLSGGARERVSSSLARQSLLEKQGVRRQGAAARLGIRSEDEARKLSLLSAIPGAELDVSKLDLAGQVAQGNQTLAAAGLLGSAEQFDIAQDTALDRFKTVTELGLETGLFETEQGLNAGEQLADVIEGLGGQDYPGFLDPLIPNFPNLSLPNLPGPDFSNIGPGVQDLVKSLAPPTIPNINVGGT